MKRKTRSILSELESIIPEKDKDSIVESRANHIIESSINLLNLINENFSEEESKELYKRFFSSLRNQDPKRFQKGIKKIKESRQNDK